MGHTANSNTQGSNFNPNEKSSDAGKTIQRNPDQTLGNTTDKYDPNEAFSTGNRTEPGTNPVQNDQDEDDEDEDGEEEDYDEEEEGEEEEGEEQDQPGTKNLSSN